MRIIAALFIILAVLAPHRAEARWQDMSSAVDDSTFSDRKPQWIADATIDTTNTVSLQNANILYDQDGDWVMTFGYALYFEQSAAGLDSIQVAIDYTIGNKFVSQGSFRTIPVTTAEWEMVQTKLYGSERQLPVEGFRLRISNSDASSASMTQVRLRAYTPDKTVN